MGGAARDADDPFRHKKGQGERAAMNPTQAPVMDLAELASQASASGGAGAVWSLASADLILSLLHFSAGDGVEAHINHQVDVISLVIAGEGVLELDDRQERLRPGLLFFIPKGARRAIRSSSADFAYLSCYLRRAGLMPTRASRERH